MSVRELLPFLKGWDNRVHVTHVTVMRGASPQIVEVNEFGHLFQLTMVTDDCYSKVEFEFKGPYEPVSVAFRPIDAYIYGATAQDPSGWAQRYTRPSRTSSAGFYMVAMWAGYATNSTIPYLDKTLSKFSLGEESTQETAQILVTSYHTVILDLEKFIRSWRAFQGTRNMDVDRTLVGYTET